jgi:hypothetical protein
MLFAMMEEYLCVIYTQAPLKELSPACNSSRDKFSIEKNFFFSRHRFFSSRDKTIKAPELGKGSKSF